MQPTVLVVGNFDGVHLGHQAIFETAKEIAQKNTHSFDVGVLTFAPHPRQFFQPGCPPFLLTLDHQRQELFQYYGLDYNIMLPFNDALYRQTPAEFFQHTLLAQLATLGKQLKHLVVGYDFCFGFNRLGDVRVLQELAAKQNISVTVVQPVLTDDGKVYASSSIRDMLRAGQITAANTAMGRPWAIEGKVIKGQQRGRTIGFPTANIAWQHYVVPKYGVYAVRVHLEDHTYNGIANIGIRPTVAGKQHNIEVHIFDFNQDIYGKTILVNILDFVREEQNFDGLETLKKQILLDCIAVKHLIDKQ